jgi:hypothetical protein
MTQAQQIISYMKSKGYQIDPAFMIVYFEGADFNLKPNGDEDDRWNDRRLIISYGAIVLNAAATTEPNKVGAKTADAKTVGGVFRIAIGQHLGCWQLGFHKTRDHWALVQCAPIWGHRDVNQDGFRNDGPLKQGKGINQHGTKPGFIGSSVGTYSLGCLVGQSWEAHKEFIWLCIGRVYEVGDLDHKFSSTVIDTNDFARWLETQ